MPQRIPRPLTAARVMLWVMSVLLLFGALASVLEVGGALGVGAATVPTVLAIACGAYAYLLPRTGPAVWWIAVALLVLLAFFQFNRVIVGDALGFLGLGYCVALVVLLVLPSSRATIRS